jgi:hypothetical protein
MKLADSMKLLPYAEMNQKISEGTANYSTNNKVIKQEVELMRDWSQVIWNKRPRVLLRKHGMTIMEKCKVNLTLDASSLIHAMNTDFTVIPERMTLYLKVLDGVVNKPYIDYLTQLYSE